ncbi:putative nuclear factor related to kappa-B-binding protein [Heracleum sosnowskyi]|uniref:Nuclear factor related to kappa-B-binding protein n=1 Tax=Heracleum sosnowskyi TaxID=360622 RepID=A0AAD8M6C1_9APIA|nr:putative nuclear factor related to kappa-B-binding protein [Heracleum sosnowskyi]
MAADQWKKRLSSVSVVGYTSRQQHSVKRKKLVSSQCDSSITSTIILEWDDSRKSVVAKREQVGIARRDLSPFIDAVPSCHNILADVVNVPEETFDLENLTDVLSYEVWQTHLSEKERNLLTQFLPEGTEAQQVVQELLGGDNFHFGNPLVKWSASLCSGDLHPDAVLKKERLLKANKKAYYSELQNYHYDMIRDLQILKARWSQADPENDFGQNFWRFRKHVDKTLPTHANRSTVHDSDDNLTSESCSSAADDKACSSDELNLRSLHEESQKRKGFMEDIHENASEGLKVVARKRKGEKIQKCNVQSGDGAKYMSYIKVSKEQYQRVKSSMKHSSNSIQSKSLNYVLGDIDTYFVQPYKVFEEEECHKLHVHWSKLANVDIAAAFSNWRRRQIKKQQLVHALGKEMAEAKKSNSKMSDDQVGDEESDSSSTEDEGSEISNRLLEDQMNNAITNREPSIAFEDEEHQSPNCVFQQQTDNTAAIKEPVMDGGSECVSIFTQNHVQHNTLLGGNSVFNTMDLESDGNHVLPGGKSSVCCL